jgi:hypothetical protein
VSIEELKERLKKVEDSENKTKNLAEKTEATTKRLEEEFSKILEILRKDSVAKPTHSSSSTGANREELVGLSKSLKLLEDTIKSKSSAEDFARFSKEHSQKLEDLLSRLKLLEDSLKLKCSKSDLDEALRNLDNRQLVKVEDSQIQQSLRFYQKESLHSKTI